MQSSSRPSGPAAGGPQGRALLNAVPELLATPAVVTGDDGAVRRDAQSCLPEMSSVSWRRDLGVAGVLSVERGGGDGGELGVGGFS